MDLLYSLGVNKTIFYQFGIFLITYLFMYYLLFKPYYNAYLQRIQNTEGNQESSKRILSDIEDLKGEHENKAREINDEFKVIYDQKRTEALHEYDTIVSDARQKAKIKIMETREKIHTELDQARVQLKTQVPEITTDIVNKLI